MEPNWIDVQKWYYRKLGILKTHIWAKVEENWKTFSQLIWEVKAFYFFGTKRKNTKTLKQHDSIHTKWNKTFSTKLWTKPRKQIVIILRN